MRESAQQRRWGAAAALIKLDREELSQAITNYLDDKSFDVRQAAVAVLGQLKDPAAIEPLIAAARATQPEHWPLKREVIRIVGEMGGDRGIDFLIDCLREKNALVAERARAALKHIGSLQVIERLVTLLNDRDSSIRNTAFVTLLDIKHPQTAGALINTFADQRYDELAMRLVLELLVDFKGQKVADLLLESLKSTDQRVRLYAVQAFGLLKDNRCLEPLLAMLPLSPPPIQSCILDVLKGMGDLRAAGPLAALFFDTKDSALQEKALEILIGMRATDQLLAILSKEGVQLQMQIKVTEALAHIRDPRAVGPPAALLSISEDIKLREVIISALGNFDDPLAVKGLSQIVLDQQNETGLRKKALVSLAQLGNREAADTFIAVLQDTAIESPPLLPSCIPIFFLTVMR